MIKLTTERPIVLLACGGHAFIQPNKEGTIEAQERNAAEICRVLITLIERGYKLVITHGNGPQVGDLLLLNESGDPTISKVPLDVLVAQTQGSIGYIIQQAMVNEFRVRNINKYVVTVITQVLVDNADEAFGNPQKPVGPFFPADVAFERRDKLGWKISKDAGGRGWRRVVPSPLPQKVIQWQTIRDASEAGHIVIAAGGGGIPIIERIDGTYQGIEAVIDKDYTSSILATEIGAEILIILTEVPCIYSGFGTPHQKSISAITAENLEEMYNADEFGSGSMGPKAKAVIGFLKRGGKRAMVTNSTTLEEALLGKGGTHVIGSY